jgi:hypothetical protein
VLTALLFLLGPVAFGAVHRQSLGQATTVAAGFANHPNASVFVLYDLCRPFTEQALG